MDRGDQGQYKIGQAAKILGLEAYVLRYWESEFPQLDPIRTDTGQRLYTERHLQVVRRIKNLLYEQGLTIEGAKRRLEDTDRVREVLDELLIELRQVRDELSAD